ncbi:MAG TPA: branched-chain amino acid ABC transporter substrate-binding protein [Azospirillum sp.]|nr:branched-chain amino acid ABC transporter substrate-binding protein [Azospirillum sp.]
MRRSLLLSIALLASAAAGPLQAADLPIALVGPMTGQLAAIGEQMKRGAQAAIDEINAKGGVQGYTLKIEVGDDQCDPKQAVAVANQMVSKGVQFVVGHACSGSSIPAAAVYGENEVFMISPASSNPAFTDDAAKNGFNTIMRTYGRDDAQGTYVGKWLAENHKDKRIAVLHDKSAYGKGLADEVKKAMNAGGLQEVTYEAITAGEKDFSALVTKLKQANVDIIYLGGYHGEAGLLVRQARDQGLNATLMTGDSLASPEFWKIAGPSGEGTLMSFPKEPRNVPAAREMVAKFKAQGFEPEGFTLFSTASVEVIAKGIERAKAAKPEAVAKALKDGQPVDTVLGPLGFDAKGDVKDPAYSIYVWHNGNYSEM